MTEPSYDADYYAGNGQSGDRPALRFYERVLRRHVPEGANVLEFGAGEGWFSRRLQEHFDTVALDASPYAQASIRKVAPRARVLTSVDEVPAEGLDAIAALHVLEHLDDPGAMLQMFRGWLRPGGVLLYVVPNPDGWGHRIKKDDWFAYRDPTHISLLGQQEWLDATTTAGFRLEQVGSDGLWDPPYIEKIPVRLQLPLFGWGAAASVLLGRVVVPRRWGECLVVVASA